MTHARPAAAEPCQACPWRTQNHGKRHPDGWYTKANARRLWAKLRTGDPMSCHPTDPSNPVSDRAIAAGSRPAAEHAERRVCAGAVILQQREVMVLQAVEDVRAYRKLRPGGMTCEGLWATVANAMFGSTPLLGTHDLGRPDLNAPVSLPHVDLPWPPPGVDLPPPTPRP